MENQKDFRADFPGNCNGYMRKDNAPDSSGNLCGTCLFEEFCVYLEIVQLSDAMKGCLPLSKKSTPAGKLVREFLGRAKYLLVELSGSVKVLNEKTSEQVD